MKVSEITREDVIQYLRIEDDASEYSLLNAIMKSALDFMMSYTGLSSEEIDEHDNLWIVFMKCCQTMYDDRAIYKDSTKNLEKFFDINLGMHRVNLL